MTVTETRTDDIRIVGGPTATDAHLLIAMQTNDAISGALDGMQLLASFETPPTLGQLRKRHPRGSHEYNCVMRFLGSCETVGTFVKNRVLHDGLVHDLYDVGHAWHISEKVCKGLRKEFGQPRTFENFELLASQAPT